MSDAEPFTQYVSLIDVDSESAQNLQELAAIWGQIDRELADIGVTVEEAYAVLGEVDFLVVFEAPSTDVAFQADVVLERHGMDLQTMEITPTDHFAQLVGDL